MRRLTLIASMLAGLVAAAAAVAQSSGPSASEREVERYRAMISDPMANPGYLAVDRGEILWAEKRGAKAASLEACDLGRGPGVLEGAYAAMPRYFADADRVMDIEQRLLWCMRTLQSLDTSDVIRRRFGEPGKTSDMEDLTAFIANKSNGMPLHAPMTAPQEKQMFAVGEAMFNRRSAVNDFSCATCHGEAGKRIRLQELPDLAHPGKSAQDSVASWPAYRVSQSQTRTMQHRLWDCYRQMRMPVPEYGSEGITALQVYMAQQADGGEIVAPSIKR